MSAQRGGPECDAPSHWTASPCDERSARRTSDADSDESRTRHFCVRERPSDTPQCVLRDARQHQERKQDKRPGRNPTRARPRQVQGQARNSRGSHTDTSTAEAPDQPHRHPHEPGPHTHTPRQPPQNQRRSPPENECMPRNGREEEGTDSWSRSATVGRGQTRAPEASHSGLTSPDAVRGTRSEVERFFGRRYT